MERYYETVNDKGEVITEDIYADFFQPERNPHSAGFVLEISLLVLLLASLVFNLIPLIIAVVVLMIALPVWKKTRKLFSVDKTTKTKIANRNEFVELLIAASFIDEYTIPANIYCECINLDPVEILIASTQYGKTIEQLEKAASSGLLAFDALEYDFVRASSAEHKNVYKVIYKQEIATEKIADMDVSAFSSVMA